jgi:hypothetical protein
MLKMLAPGLAPTRGRSSFYLFLVATVSFVAYLANSFVVKTFLYEVGRLFGGYLLK